MFNCYVLVKFVIFFDDFCCLGIIFGLGEISDFKWYGVFFLVDYIGGREDQLFVYFVEVVVLFSFIVFGVQVYCIVMYDGCWVCGEFVCNYWVVYFKWGGGFVWLLGMQGIMGQVYQFQFNCKMIQGFYFYLCFVFIVY